MRSGQFSINIYRASAFKIPNQTVSDTSSESGFTDGTLHLYVYEVNSGIPLSDVLVSVQDSFGNGRMSRTDSNGFAGFGAQPGTWQYEISKEGYITASGTFEVINTERQDIYLTPL
jgi:hypothetical protein